MTKLILLSLVALSACTAKVSTSDTDSGHRSAQNKDYASQPASGLLGGQPWVFKSGTARVSPMGDGLSLELGDRATSAPCGFERSDRQVLFGTPAEKGETQLSGSGRTLTFVYDENGRTQNVITDNGKIEITEVTASSVSGRIVGEYDNANSVNGTFTVERCAD